MESSRGPLAYRLDRQNHCLTDASVTGFTQPAVGTGPVGPSREIDPFPTKYVKFQE